MFQVKSIPDLYYRLRFSLNIKITRIRIILTIITYKISQLLFYYRIRTALNNTWEKL